MSNESPAAEPEPDDDIRGQLAKAIAARMQTVESESPMPPGYVELERVADRVRKVKYHDDAAPPLTEAERVLLRKLYPPTALLPGRVNPLSLEVMSNPGLQKAYEAVRARNHIIEIQDDAAADWLFEIKVLRELPDGREVIPLGWLSKSEEPSELPSRAKISKPAGGRPESHHWEQFDHEIVRRLTLDGLDTSRLSLRRHMKDWAGKNMTSPPDDRTIERRIDKIVPGDIWVDGG